MKDVDFPLQEYEDRIKRIQKKMSEKGLDALITLGAENIHYICGYDGAWTAPVAEFSCVVIPVKGEPRLLVRDLESRTAEYQSTKAPRTYNDWEGPWEALNEILEESKATKGTIGMEESIITLRRFNQLQKNLPEAKIASAAGLVERVMSEPSKLEIEYVRKAGEITQAGFQRAIETVKEDVRFYEIINQAELAMYRAGMTEQRLHGSYILTCVWGGPDGGALHDTDVTRKVQKLDLVTTEIWGNYKHYVACAQGTVYVGHRPPSNITDTYKHLSEMYVAVREAMKPGVSCGEVWEAGSKLYRCAYGVDYYRGLGRQRGAGGVGRIDKGVMEPLRPGTAYFVSPLETDPLLMTVGGCIMVTEAGCEEITKPLLKLVTV